MLLFLVFMGVVLLYYILKALTAKERTETGAHNRFENVSPTTWFVMLIICVGPAIIAFDWMLDITGPGWVFYAVVIGALAYSRLNLGEATPDTYWSEPEPDSDGDSAYFDFDDQCQNCGASLDGNQRCAECGETSAKA